jgi:integrase
LPQQYSAHNRAQSPQIHPVCIFTLPYPTIRAWKGAIEWVRQSAKRRKSPDILTTNEVQSLLANLCFRERTLVLLAVTNGLRRSEVFALKWKDVDFETKQIHVTRSIVQKVVGICKTASSQKPVRAHNDLIVTLRNWHSQTRYKSPENWVFASPVNQGRWPYLAQQIMRHHILTYCAEAKHKQNELAGTSFAIRIPPFFDLPAPN